MLHVLAVTLALTPLRSNATGSLRSNATGSLRTNAIGFAPLPGGEGAALPSLEPGVGQQLAAVRARVPVLDLGAPRLDLVRHPAEDPGSIAPEDLLSLRVGLGRHLRVGCA